MPIRVSFFLGMLNVFAKKNGQAIADLSSDVLSPEEFLMQHGMTQGCLDIQILDIQDEPLSTESFLNAYGLDSDSLIVENDGFSGLGKTWFIKVFNGLLRVGSLCLLVIGPA